MADLRTGALRPTRDSLRELLDQLEPIAQRLGAGAAMSHARELAACNGAMSQRRVAAGAGIPSVPGWLASQFLEA